MATAAAMIGERLGWARLANWRPLAPYDDELLLVPKDLRTADPIFAAELASGQMGLAGVVATIRHHSPFEIAPPSEAWLAALHGFGWLRHLRAARSSQAVAVARALFDDWHGRQRQLQQTVPTAFAPEVVARRVLALLTNADILLDGADPARYRLVHQVLATSIRELERMRPTVRGRAQLACDIALVTAALALADHERLLAARQRDLLASLERQILRDGGHASRNGDVVVALLIDLLPLRQCYLARSFTPPQALIDTTGSMLGFLRAMQMGNGALARFHGVQGGARDALSTVLALDVGIHGAKHVLADSGYVRLEQGKTIVIMDCGSSPSGGEKQPIYQSPLAFEMSSGRRRILGNGGAPSGIVAPATLAAATVVQSHATLALGSIASSQVIKVTPYGTSVTDDAITAGGTHDAYVPGFGLNHSRNITLSDGGRTLDGRDELRPPAGVLRTPRDVPFAIRFHLDAAVAAKVDLDGSRAVLCVGDIETWELTVSGARASLEPSVDYTFAGGPRAGEQIVLRGTSPGQTVVTWKLSRQI